jgi:hypothetical protein
VEDAPADAWVEADPERNPTADAEAADLEDKPEARVHAMRAENSRAKN